MKIKVLDKKTLLVFIVLFLELIFLGSGYLPGANIAVLFLILCLFLFPKIDFKFGNLECLMLFYISYLALITLIKFPSNYNKNNSIMSIVEYLIIFVCCHTIANNINYDAFVLYIRRIGVLLGLFGIIESIIQTPFLSYLTKQSVVVYTVATQYRTVLIFQHPIVCGVFLLIPLVALIEFPFKNVWKQFLSLGIIVISIILTRSRSVWITALVILAITGFKRFKLTSKIAKSKVVHLLQYVFIFLVVISIFSILLKINVIQLAMSFINSRIAGSLDAGAGQGNIIRIETVTNSFDYWFSGNMSKFIFGMGKNYDKYFLATHPVIKWGVPWTAAIDNQYITTIHESGIIGLAIIFSIILVTFKRIITNPLFDNKKSRLKEFVNLCIINIFVTNYFYEGLNYMSIMTFLWIFIVISDKIDHTDKPTFVKFNQNGLIADKHFY